MGRRTLIDCDRCGVDIPARLDLEPPVKFVEATIRNVSARNASDIGRVVTETICVGCAAKPLVLSKMLELDDPDRVVEVSFKVATW